MKEYLNLKFIALACLVALGGQLVSCVGQIESGDTKTTVSSTIQEPSTVVFNGIVEVNAISNDKVEVYFFGATGGSGEFSYQIHYGDEIAPKSVAQSSLERDYRGLYRYTLTGLTVGTKYVISVDVTDTKKSKTVSTEKYLPVWTFTNLVADFTGISSVSNLPGVDGLDSVKVRWPHATVFVDQIFGSPQDPKSYEVTLIDSDQLTPASFNNRSLGDAQGRIVRTFQYDALVNETVVRGLQSNKTYYVNVKAIHKGTIDDPNKPNLRSEFNSRYLEIKTLDQNAADIDFNPDEFVASNNTGKEATNSMILTWGTVLGVFDHFRIYYAENSNLVVNTALTCAQDGSTSLASGATFCKKVEYNKTSSLITDLLPLVQYQFKLMICLDASCSQSIAYPTILKTTQVAVASFNGISSIGWTSDLLTVGRLDLNFSPIDFTTGFFDGLAVEFTDQRIALNDWIADQGNPKPPTDIITDSAYTGVLDVLSFDYLTASKIVVDNVDYASGGDYCFAIYPYLLDSLGAKTYLDSNAVWRCTIPTLVAPTKDEFAGVNDGVTDRKNVTISWSIPSKGIYSHFEIFYRLSISVADNNFDFSTAITDTTVNYDFSNYKRILANRDNGFDGSGNPLILQARTIPNLPNGRYLVGVLTYYNYGVGAEIRSEENESVYACVVDGVGSNTCTLVP